MVRPSLVALAWLCASGAAEQVAVGARGSQEAQIRASSARGCADALPDCASLARADLTGCAENASTLLAGCARTCGTCSYRALIDKAAECADIDSNCANWARGGECDKNPRYMLQSCPVACGTCDAKRTGCNRRPDVTPAMVAPGGMDAMFERALADFPELEPRALSTSPWVLQFENLVTAEEASAFVGACRKFDRSLAGDQVSLVRTSTQCWCDTSDDSGKCMEHPAVVALTDRMLNITREPYNNAEYFQVLRYEPGQFYRSHHDQQSGHWTPQGVRVLTFFVYLSDVEEGGGTRFSDLDLTVQPKLGRAILWPSVIGDDLRTSEPKTHHEALAVGKGVKLGANLWLHMYDFKTPSQSGLCVFLGQNSNH